MGILFIITRISAGLQPSGLSAIGASQTLCFADRINYDFIPSGVLDFLVEHFIGDSELELLGDVGQQFLLLGAVVLRGERFAVLSLVKRTLLCFGFEVAEILVLVFHWIIQKLPIWNSILLALKL